MLGVLKARLLLAGKELDEDVKGEMNSLVKRCLLHVHIFQPQSWSSLLATLRALPDYLFGEGRHRSMHRRSHSIILEDLDTFVWPIRNSTTSAVHDVSPLSTASIHLTTSLQELSTLFSSAIILTSTSTLPTTFRPPMPTSWFPGAQITRLAVRRVEVVKFAAAISIDEAAAERQQRWQVVCRSRFECWRLAAGLRDGEGFVFRNGMWEIEVETVCGLN